MSGRFLLRYEVRSRCPRERLVFRLNESGLPLDGGIETMFDYIDADEGRPPKTFP